MTQHQHFSTPRHIKIIFWIALIYSLIMLLLFVNTPFHQEQAFRQAQTALTTYWLPLTHQWIAYQTPVLGYPWTIPFEFPTYQWIVAVTHEILPFSLNTTGRLISIIFMYLNLIPLYFFLRLFNFKARAFYLAATLFVAAPYVIQWSHAFLIESCVLFLSFRYLTTAAYFLQTKKWLFLGLSTLLGMLAIVSKVTTFTPAAVFIFVLLVFQAHQEFQNIFSFRSIKKYFFPAVLLFLFPLFAEIMWSHFADLLKSGNDLGATLTSKNLFFFNFGTPLQRASPHILFLLFFKKAMAIVPTYLIIIGVFLYFRKRSIFPKLAALSCLMYLVGPMVFTNLYLQEHYWLEVSIYLTLGCALFLEFLYEIKQEKWAMGLLILTLMTQIAVINPPKILKIHAQARQDQDYQIGLFIRNHTPSNTFILVYGQDWSSEIAYYAERKSLTDPIWKYTNWMSHIKNLKFYQGGLPLSAVVLCNKKALPPELISGVQPLLSSLAVNNIGDCEVWDKAE